MPKVPDYRAATLGEEVTTAPGTLGGYAERYLQELIVRNYSPTTLRTEAIYLRFFVAWCEERGVTAPEEIALPLLKSYRRHLHHYRRANGLPLTASTQWDRLAKVKRFFRWLEDEGYLVDDPARKLRLPRVEQRLPRGLFSEAQAESILGQPDVGTVLGLRDRALLEVFYATGLRRAELTNLEVRDIDLLGGTVIVRQGKGKKDRLLPLSERAAAWLTKYLEESRPRLVRGHEPGALFLSQTGTPVSYGHVGHIVHQAMAGAGIVRDGACHLFRHTMATLMLEGGADIRYVQKMLGHTSLKSTEVYTHVAIHKLREVHAKSHPGARLSRRQRRQLGWDEAPPLAAEPLEDDAEQLAGHVDDAGDVDEL